MTDDSHQLAADLRNTLMRSTRRLRREGSRAAISDVQYSVLARLDREGPQTVGALADFERVQPPSMTRTVACLVETALVTRTRHPDDGRVVLVELTEQGRAEVVTARAARTAWLADQLDTLTADERRTLAAAAVLLREVMSR